MESNRYTEEELHWLNGGNTGMLPTRITPSAVNVLKPDEVFVFGSNFQGHHMGGAARFAQDRFGAVWGIGEGLQGQSYAIPTMEGIDNLRPAIERFTSFAHQHQELKFYVTAIGCGIAGYREYQIAPYFLKASYYSNVYLPLSFWQIILKIADANDDVQRACQHIIDLCYYMHRHNLPDWNGQTDESIFNSLQRPQHWRLGILLGVINPAEIEPSVKRLPQELLDKILGKLKEV